MAFDGTGSFDRLYSWVTDRINNVKIQAARMDAEDDGFATGLSLAICKDGQSTTSARIPFAAGIGLSDGSVSAPSLNFTADTNTGLYSSGADIIAVAAGGVKVLEVDGATASAATGIKVTSAAAASRVSLAAISSGTNEGLSIDAKGSGTIRLGATSTGAVEFSRAAVPTSSDGAALGTASLMWSDLFLASTAVINFNNGNMTITHSAGDLAVAGGTVTLPNTGLHLLDTNGSHDLIIAPGSDLSADRTLTITTGDAARTVTLAGNLTTAADFITAGANSLTLTTTGTTDVTLPTSGTLAAIASSTWTPGLTFATAGDASIVLSTANGRYVTIGSLVIVEFEIVTSTFTHTTASGALTISGLPFTVGTGMRGFLRWRGITKANYTEMVLGFATAGTTMIISASGSGQNVSTVTASDTPTGGTVDLRGVGFYLV